MARSLEEYIREFARRARNQLEAEIAEKKNQKVRPVEWQGFDADGRPIVKDGDQTRVARGMGNVSQVKGSRLIYDEQGSVEYKRRKKEEPPAPAKEIVRVQQKKPVYRSSLIPIEIFDAVSQIRNVIGNYIISYNSWKQSSALYLSSQVFTTNAGREFHANTAYVNYSFSTDNCDRSIYNYSSLCSTNQDTTCTPDSVDRVEGGDNQIYSVVHVSAYLRQWNSTIFPASQSATLTINVGDKSESLTLPVDSQGIQTGRLKVSNYGATDSTSLSYEGFTGDQYFSSAAQLRFVTGAAFILTNAKVYYEFEEGSAFIDLNSIISGNILNYKKIHEYRTREIIGQEEEVIVYSVFAVMTVVDKEITVYHDYGNAWIERRGFGELKHYFVHTKFNLTTEELESRVTEASKHQSYNGNVLHLVNWIGQYVIEQEIIDNFPFGCFCMTYADNANYVYIIDRLELTMYNTGPLQSHGFFMELVDPSPIFENAFDGDWISQVSFDSSTYNIHDDSEVYGLYQFLELNYYNGILDDYITANIPVYPRQGNCSTLLTQTAGTYSQADLSSITTASQMESIVQSINASTDLIGDIIDISGWTQSFVARDQNYQVSTIRYGRIVRSLTPLLPSNLVIPTIEFDTQCSLAIYYDEFFLRYVCFHEFKYMLNNTILHNSGPLREYAALNGIVTISTKFGNSFDLGDTVLISGSGVIDGSHTVTQRDSDFTFKISLATSDTATTTIGGTATKQ